jgi:hypothetical protein
VRKIMAGLAAISMAVAPVALSAQTVPPPAYPEDRDNKAATLAGVILAVLILGVAIKAIGGRDRPLPAPPAPVSP